MLVWRPAESSSLLPFQAVLYILLLGSMESCIARAPSGYINVVRINV